MKKSELKEMIKAAYLSEADFTNAQDDDAALGGMYDPVYEAKEEESADEILARLMGTSADPYMAEDLEKSDVESAITGKTLDLKKLEDATKKAMGGNSTDLTMFLAGLLESTSALAAAELGIKPLNEAEEEETEIKVDAEEETEGGKGKASDSIVIDKKIVSLSSLPDKIRKILDSLETLRVQAEEFGDQKFITQVGNTITFFTRDFVVAGDEPTRAKVDESVAFPLWNQIK